MTFKVFGFVALMTSICFAGSYEYLKAFESDFTLPAIEQSHVAASRDAALEIAMNGYYEEFANLDEISIYIGTGVEWTAPNQVQQLFDMLKAIAQQKTLDITDWQMSGSKITFFDKQKQLRYSITVGTERDQFADSFSKSPVVMYLGHSRYGRGPAFEDMTNYFRMSDEYQTVEMDVRNKYFLTETILKTDEFPLQSVTLDGKNYQFQYRGQKNTESHLGAEAYTKIIEGNAVDLDNATFWDGKQLVFLDSCSNEQHWKKLLRSRFSDPQQTLFFGTNCDTGVGMNHASIVIMSIVRQLPNSTNFVAELKGPHPCPTVY